MNIHRAFKMVAVLAFALSACGGGSKAAPTTVPVTSPPAVATTVPAPTTVPETTTTPAPTTTVAETTTTVVDYSYQLDVSTLVCNDVGECDLPADFPADAQNPNDPEALTLNQIKVLATGSPVCVHLAGGGNMTGTIGDKTAVVVIAGGVAEPYPAIYLVQPNGIPAYFGSVSLGVSPAPDGVTWAPPGSHITAGSC